MNDLQSFIGRSFKSIKSLGKNKKGSDNGGLVTADDDLSPGAAAADKLPI